MSDLEQLVRKSQAGDLGSFEEIVVRFQKSAFGYAFSAVGDSHLAEDAVQEAFVNAFCQIGQLREPRTFSAWFRKVLRSSCGEYRRQRERIVISSSDPNIDADGPHWKQSENERNEREQMVHSAIQSLPDSLRMVTAFHYIGGMPQAEIAEFLSLSLSAVKKRLQRARDSLKKEILDMVNTIAEEKSPNERVSARVIAELVGRAQLLFIPDHPIRLIVDQVRGLLDDYEFIESREIEDKEVYPSIRHEVISEYENAYQLDSHTVLRMSTTGATIRAIKGKESPVCLLTVGRVYRPEREDKDHLKVFHQLDGICVRKEASKENLKKTCAEITKAILGEKEIHFSEANYGWVEYAMNCEVRYEGKWLEIIGCGMLKEEMLRDAGFEPDQVSGYAFGLGLERLAQLKLGLKSVHELWRQPYFRGLA